MILTKLKTLFTIAIFCIITNSAYAIWNGNEANGNDYKFMVSIQAQYVDASTWTHWCGGSLINNKFILTAGHCIADSTGKAYPTNMVQIITQDGSIFTAKTFYLNPNFYWQNIPEAGSELAENDLALIELDHPVTNMKTVKLPKIEDSSDYYAAGNNVLAIGYGYYDMRCDAFNPNQYCAVSYPVLRTAYMNILPDNQMQWEDSNGIINSAANPYFYPNLFVGAYSETQAPTAHDSGSPLLIKDIHGDYTIIGTYSAGVSTPQLFQPSIYTRLDTKDNIEWINDTINH